MNRRDQLIEDHLNCVHWVIRYFIHVNSGVCGLEYDDLYQEGCIALWRAAETFDEQQGAQFHSYATSVIRNRMYSGVARLGVEALELKIAGYSGTDIAKLYGVQPNHVGAWISRAAQKLKKDLFLVENGSTNP